MPGTKATARIRSGDTRYKQNRSSLRSSRSTRVCVSSDTVCDRRRRAGRDRVSLVEPRRTSRRLGPGSFVGTPESSTPTLVRTIQDQIAHILSSDSSDNILATVRMLAVQCQQLCNVSLQEPFIRNTLFFLLGRREPHVEQVRVARRLVFGLGDTILVAKTGFGKSIALHAYSVITGYITLQIIPLSKLGKEQEEGIARYPGARPCLITEETKDSNPNLFSEILAGRYTHILLGPEQAISPTFYRLFLVGSFVDRVRLVAIDECHVIRQWREFRTAYIQFHELRRMMCSATLFFACTATFDAATEDQLLQSGCFQTLANSTEDTPMRLRIIRTSVDRPEIAIGIVPIPIGCQTSYNQLVNCMDMGIDTETSQIVPSRIPKTIIFLDGRDKIAALARLIQSRLLGKGCPLTDVQSVRPGTDICQLHRRRVSDPSRHCYNCTWDGYGSVQCPACLSVVDPDYQ